MESLNWVAMLGAVWITQSKCTKGRALMLIEIGLDSQKGLKTAFSTLSLQNKAAEFSKKEICIEMQYQ